MIVRRDFIKTGLMASALSTLRPEPMTAQATVPSSKTFEMSLGLKGQFLYLIPSANGQPEAVCLRSPEGRMHHYGWLFVSASGVAASQPEPQYTSKDGSWKGWQITAGRIELKGLGLKPEARRGRPPARTPPGRKAKHWPNDVNEDKDWQKRDWIPSLTELAPHLAIDKVKLVDNTFFSVVLPAGGSFTGRKPCKKRDIVALWKWETKDDEILKAATDRVQYTTMVASKNEASITIPGGFVRLKAPEKGNLIACDLTCAPDWNEAVAGSDLYQLNDPVEHFKRFNDVLTKAELPMMRYLCHTKSPDQVTIADCTMALIDRDDDIFCPGMEGPKP